MWLEHLDSGVGDRNISVAGYILCTTGLAIVFRIVQGSVYMCAWVVSLFVLSHLDDAMYPNVYNGHAILFHSHCAGVVLKM